MSLEPSCILCLSQCDNGGFLTSCEHFFCSRCVQRLQQQRQHNGNGLQACPICKKQDIKLLPLTHKSLRPLFQDPGAIMNQSQRVVTAQLMHYRQIHHRMREALKVLNAKYQGMDGTLKATQRELQETKETLRTVQQYTQKQKKEIEELSKSSSAQPYHPSGISHSRESSFSARLSPHQHTAKEHMPLWASGQGATGTSPSPSFPHLCGEEPQSPCHTKAQIPHSFPSLGWSATSSVMKRCREDEGAAARSDNPSPAPKPAAPPFHIARHLHQAQAPLLSTPLVQSLNPQFVRCSSGSRALPSPVRAFQSPGGPSRV